MALRPRSRSVLGAALLALLLAACGGGEDAEVAGSPGYDAWKRGREDLAAGRVEPGLEALREAVRRDPENGRLVADLAEALLEEGRVGEAAALLDPSTGRFPADPRVVLRRGELMLALSRFDQAIPELERATTLDPESADAWEALGRARFERSILFLGTTSIDREKLRGAIEALERAAELDPERPDLHALLGRAYWRDSDLERARQHFERAAELDPADVETHRSLGSLLVKMGELDAAGTALQRAAVLAPKDHLTAFEQGLLDEERGDLERALAAYDRTAELRPSFSKAQFRRSSVLRRLGRDEDADRAEQAYERLWQREQELESRRLAALAAPNDPKRQLEAAFAHFDAGELDQAVGFANRSLALLPNAAPAWHVLGRVQLARGELDYAAQTLGRARELAPGEAPIALDLARLELAQFARTGEPERGQAAKALLEEVLAAYPDPYVHDLLGTLLVGLDDVDGAIEHLRRASGLLPGEPRFHFNLASALLLRGEVDAAIERYERVLALAPEHPHARERLEEARRQRDAPPADEAQGG